MDNIHEPNDPHCRELEHLAAAAATRDYSPSLLDAAGTHQEPHEQHGETISFVHNSDGAPADLSSTSSTSQFLYSDSYETRSFIIPGRLYEFQQFEEAAPNAHTCNSRFIMAASSNPISDNIQSNKEHSSHIMLHSGNEVHYEAPYENPIQLISHSQHVVQDHRSQQVASCSEPVPLQCHNDPLPVSYGPSACEKPVTFSKSNNSDKIVKDSEKSKKREAKLPDAMKDSNGMIYYLCPHCDTKFTTISLWKQHQLEHSLKRNGLSLEVKIEIIKRINAGEKKADIAEEYSVNRSTIKSIMKKSNDYLSCWNQGMYNPGSKRLKGPKREDVELALHCWYIQAIEKNEPVSGPILCAKAMNFARELGHHDFKATHGWLDRFKKRNKISFGKGSLKRSKASLTPSDERSSEFNNSAISSLINDKEPSDIFVLGEIGIFYHASPKDIPLMKGQRCAGGTCANDRLTVLLCSSLTGSEKFPLLVVGNCKTYRNHRFSKALPLNYIYNENSWLNPEIVSAWLHDIDSWLAKQNRKVLLISSSLPIYSSISNLKFTSIKFVVLPSYSSSPLSYLATEIFKKIYRYTILIEWINLFESEIIQSGNMAHHLSLETCLHLLYSTWNGISDGAIAACFQKSGLFGKSKYAIWCPSEPIFNFPKIQEFLKTLETYGLSNHEVTFTDFVHFDDNIQVCELKDDEEILATVKRIKKEQKIDKKKLLNQKEIAPTCSNSCLAFVKRQEVENNTYKQTLVKVESAFNTVREFLQHQEGTQGMFQVLSNLEGVYNKSLLHKSFTHYPH